MHELRRPVHFQDVDAAGIVFFANFFVYAHDAMVSLFDTVPGGYAGFIVERRVGFPVVHVDADFKAPLRFGDVPFVRVTVPKVGDKSATLRFEIVKDGATCAVVTHVVVMTDFHTMKGVPLTEDVRALLLAHRT